MLTVLTVFIGLDCKLKICCRPDKMLTVCCCSDCRLAVCIGLGCMFSMFNCVWHGLPDVFLDDLYVSVFHKLRK